MLHRPANARPLGLERRTGKTRTLSKDSPNVVSECSRRRNNKRNDLDCSCAATIGSDISGENSRRDFVKVDVTNPRTALNIVYSYDSSKDLKLPRLNDRRQNRSLRNKLFLSSNSSLIDRYKEYIKLLAEHNDSKMKKITSEKGSSVLSWEKSIKTEKENEVKSQKKREVHPTKTILKKTTALQKKLEAGDSSTQKRKNPTECEKHIAQSAESRPSKTAPDTKQERGDMHRVSFKFPPRTMSSQFPHGSSPDTLRSGGYLSTIPENTDEERSESENKSRNKEMRPKGRRPHPTTKNVHDWLVVSSHKVLATKEVFTPKMEPESPPMSPKMVECKSGVLGMSETAGRKRKEYRKSVRYLIHKECSSTKTAQSSKDKSVNTKGRSTSLHYNSPASGSTVQIDMYSKPFSNQSKKSMLMNIVAYDDVKEPIFPAPSHRKGENPCFSIALARKARRRATFPKSPKQQVQNSPALFKEFKTPLSNRYGSATRRKEITEPKSQKYFTKGRQQWEKTSLKKNENQVPLRGGGHKKIASDLFKSWILGLPNR